jgi:hypothetical protein
VRPAKVRGAWEQLDGTRWQNTLNLTELLSRDLESDRYDALTREVDPAVIRAGVDHVQSNRRQMRQDAEIAQSERK